MLVVLLIEVSSRIDLVPNWCLRLLMERAIGLIDLIVLVIVIERIVTVADVGFVGVGIEEVVHDWELVETCLEVIELVLGVCLGDNLVEVDLDLIEAKVCWFYQRGRGLTWRNGRGRKLWRSHGCTLRVLGKLIWCGSWLTCD